MAELFITYWRDIPSQVSVKAGRRGPKAMLSERFQEAIDMAAMRTGAAQSDDYIAQWRRGEPFELEGEAKQALAKQIEAIENEYNDEKLKALIENGGSKA